MWLPLVATSGWTSGRAGRLGPSVSPLQVPEGCKTREAALGPPPLPEGAPREPLEPSFLWDIPRSLDAAARGPGAGPFTLALPAQNGREAERPAARATAPRSLGPGVAVRARVLAAQRTDVSEISARVPLHAPPQPWVHKPLTEPCCVIKYFIGKKNKRTPSSQERGRGPGEVGDRPHGRATSRSSGRDVRAQWPARPRGSPTRGSGVCRGPPEAGGVQVKERG